MGKTVIYIDSLFALNTIINYLLLLAAACVSGCPFKRWRLALGAAAGGGYAVLVMLPGLGALSSLPGKLAAAAVMAAIAFLGRDPRVLFRRTLVFFGASFAFGGAVYAVYFLTGGLSPRSPYIHVELRTILLAAAVCWAIISLVFKGSALHGGLRRDITKVRAALGDSACEFFALLDTGNTLSDPLTNSPVIVSELESVRTLLPKGLLPLLRENAPGKASALFEAMAAIDEGRMFRLVPYRAVGVESGMLLAFRPDSVEIGGKKSRGALIALSPGAISDGGGYSAVCGAAACENL